MSHKRVKTDHFTQEQFVFLLISAVHSQLKFYQKAWNKGFYKIY